jgi:large subunit ribosomal protein L17
MRHGKKFNHLGRKSVHRKSMLANMATSLILHKRITTTLAKAKALRVYVEPLITRSKEDTTHSRRVVFSYLESKEAVTELFREVSTKVAERPGGYTRILKLGQRVGDSAEMAIIELVDFNVNLLETKDASKAKATRRGRRGTGKKKDEEVAAEVAESAKPRKTTAKKEAAPAPEPVKQPEPQAAEEPEIIAQADEPAADQPEAETEEETKA